MGVLNPFSYCGGNIRRNGASEAPHAAFTQLLHVESADLYFRWKQTSSPSDIMTPSIIKP